VRTVRETSRPQRQHSNPESMTASSAPPTTSKRDAAIELAMVLAVALALRVALRNEAVQAVVPPLPVLQRSWVLFLGTIAMLVWLVRRHAGNVAEFGLKPFAPWPRMLALGVLGALAAVALDIVTGPFIRAMFGKPDLQRIGSVENDLPTYLMLIVAGFVFGGLGEELLFRGFILTRLRVLLGEGRARIALALAIQGAIFGLAHAYQGPSGMLSTALLGVVYGLIFLRAGSNVWPAAIAHALLDTLGFTLLYLGMMK
jgi:uncharacterized protein